MKRDRHKNIILPLLYPDLPDSGKMTGIWQMYVTMCVCLKFVFYLVSEMKMSDMSKSLHRKAVLEKEKLQPIKTQISLVSSKSPLSQPHLCPWLRLLMTLWPSEFHSDLAQWCILRYLDSFILLSPHTSVCQIKCHFLLSMGCELLLSKGHSEKNSFSHSSRWQTLLALN